MRVGDLGFSTQGLVFAAALLLAACSTTPPANKAGSSASDFASQKDGTPLRAPTAAEMQDAQPRNEPILPRGNKTPYVVAGKQYQLIEDHKGFSQRGTASWYGTKFHGRYTSNGEVYDVYSMSAAHKTLPIPVFVRVTNLENGRQAVVRVNDRGPFHDDRIIDLSYSAAVKLGFANKGTAAVEIEVIDTDNSPLIGEPTQYFLQVAAFQQLRSAQQLEASLSANLGFPVQIASSSQRDSAIHRVRVGPLKDFSTVQDARKNLAKVWSGQPQLLVENSTVEANF
ncbi:septal ring lytic transglycosylase RlpA family protein [Spongiibacter sp. KMU-158]|uniref:Endolytic peptidoglycan transglycosylase RlpA n=1 Tax=Spongiibacter pelagi TaxID=2760804 RepID=A0A927C2X9_9GAMM|nr:septal ring lytic transglycosylase RlpA family protein [Spongiibacter pelagi]MBD2858867.1 septal ring lytic transglycosylase RlpA family protein [Spongiibacter pelagi]